MARNVALGWPDNPQSPLSLRWENLSLRWFSKPANPASAETAAKHAQIYPCGFYPCAGIDYPCDWVGHPPGPNTSSQVPQGLYGPPACIPGQVVHEGHHKDLSRANTRRATRNNEKTSTGKTGPALKQVLEQLAGPPQDIPARPYHLHLRGLTCWIVLCRGPMHTPVNQPQEGPCQSTATACTCPPPRPTNASAHTCPYTPQKTADTAGLAGLQG